MLNNTRTAYGKLRNEVGDIEKKLAASERECQTLRQDLVAAQSLLHTLETTKTDFSIDLATGRAQIADLESNLAQRTGECLALREENRRFDERLVTAEKRIIALESDITAARQRLLIADDEKRAQHILLDKAGVEAARLSRKVTETEASFNAVQGRLRHAEASINEASIERARLVTTLDELNERHERERAGQNMRFDSLQSRAATLEKVVADARELLLARAEQIREYDRRNGEVATERNELQERVSNLQAALIEYESKYKEADQTRSAYMERNGALARALTAKEAALAQAEDANASLTDRVGALETARRREADRRAEDHRTRRGVAPRKARSRGGGRRAGDRPQGLLPGDARSDGAATQPAGAGRAGAAARRQRRIRISTELAASPGRARRCRFWSIDLPQGRPAPVPLACGRVIPAGAESFSNAVPRQRRPAAFRAQPSARPRAGHLPRGVQPRLRRPCRRTGSRKARPHDRLGGGQAQLRQGRG